ncbi:MAG: zinc-binding alcohol dehydrogenase family protein, partial [Beijerinckiaceae bacterium]
DTLSLSSIATGEVLRELQPGFASGHLKPFPIASSAVFPLNAAREAYAAVLGSSRDRMIFRPGN